MTRAGMVLGGVLLCLCATAGAAQERVVATYGATLGREDYFNSSGARLTSRAAIIAQDRANYHRFGIRHQGDRSDPVFSKRENRAQIPNVPVTIASSLEGYITQALERGYTPFVAVTIYAVGNRITRLRVEVPG